MTTESRSPSPEFSPLALGEGVSPLPEYKAAGDTALDLSGLLPAPLQLHEDLTSGCGGQTWPAGMVLAKHMVRYHRDRLQQARILELGAGGGLVGLAVARGCEIQNTILATDKVEMVPLMEHNIGLNELQDHVQAMVLDWGEALPRTVADFKPDVILAADCVYFEPAFPLLLATLTELLALCPAATIYFCFKKRRRADMQFLKKARGAFLVEEIHDDDRPAFSREGLFLHTFRHKQYKVLVRSTS